MTQLDDLQAYTNVEMPRRIVLLTPLITGYDGDPNDGGAPAIITNAPTTTLYRQETPSEIVWQKTGDGSWIEIGSGGLRGDWYGDELKVYVDPAGDDSNPGTETEPIQTWAEAMSRVPPSGSCRLKFAAGTYDVVPFGYEARIDNQIVGNLVIEGEYTTMTTCAFDSESNGTITVQGSPGWTPGEWAGKRLRWDPYSGAYPDYIESREIIDNGADTLVVAWCLPSIGGFSGPSAGDSMEIVEHATTINFKNLSFNGYATLLNLRLDGDPASASWGVYSYSPAGIQVKSCLLENCFAGLLAAHGSKVSGLSSSFKNSQYGLFGYASVFEMLDCYYEGLTEPFYVEGSFAFAGNRYLWVKDCTRVFEIRGGGTVLDSNFGQWLNNVDAYAQVWSNAAYAKGSPAFNSFDPTKIDCNNYCFDLPGTNARVTLYNSDSDTMGPDAQYIRFGSNYVSKTDHITYGKATYDMDKNNAVIG